MRLLLDTHVAIWALTAPRLLTDPGRDLIEDSENDVYVSAVAVWEIAIKRAAGKASAPSISSLEALAAFGQLGFAILNVTAVHAAAVERLPLLHRDPFDRILVAQALCEPLVLLTHDPKVASYSDSILIV